MKRVLIAALLASTSLLLALEPEGAWVAKVPAHEARKPNPFAGQPDAVSAGRHLFEENCAKCHGSNAEGRGKKPALASERVQQEATDGQLHWFIKNGSLGRGMPAWSRLPDQQLWQIVSYLKTLKPVATRQ